MQEKHVRDSQLAAAQKAKEEQRRADRKRELEQLAKLSLAIEEDKQAERKRS